MTNLRVWLKRSRFFLRSNPLFGVLRFLVWQRALWRERSYLAGVSRNLNLKIGNLVDELEACAKGKETTTLFVLGNGFSANRISADNFEEVGAAVSVGVNAWPLHHFVPDFYAFEFHNRGSEPDPELINLLEVIDRRKICIRDSKIVFLRPSIQSGSKTVPWISEDLRKRSFLVGRVNLVSSSLKALEVDLHLALRYLSFFRGLSGVLPDNGSSVIRIICAGVLAGFKQIVLIGVDLNESPYFWYSDKFIDEHGDFRTLFPRAPLQGAATNSTENRPLPAKSFICCLADVAHRGFGTSILLGARGSSLADCLREYKFHR